MPIVFLVRSLLLTTFFCCTATAYGQLLGPKPIFAETIGNVSRVTPYDFDTDGDIDLVFSYDGKGAWMRNDGTGVLSEPIVFFDVPGRYVQRLLPAGDLNGDGAEDMLIDIHESDNATSFSSFLNNGAGQFGQENLISWTDPNANSGGLIEFFMEDIDLDGKKDLLFERDANGQHRLYWRPNTGLGNFSGGSEIEYTFPMATAVADFDGDSDNDVLNVVDYQADFCIGFWRQNPGNGNFENSNTFGSFQVNSPDITNVTTFDYDQDGDPDPLVSSLDKIYIFNNGTGTITPLAELSESIASGALCYVLSEDMDNDGWPDVVFTQNGNVGWFRNEMGSGSFTLQPPSFPNVTVGWGLMNSGGFLMADWDGDGLKDLILTGYGSAGVCLNTGAGRFDRSEQFLPQMGYITCMQALDADGDADEDFFALTNRRLYYFRNEGGGQFAAPQTATHEIIANNITYTYKFVLADFNGDTLPDLLTTNGDIAVSLNLGDATFGTRIPLDTAGLFQPYDLDSDGDLDVVGYSSQSGSNRWYRNDGTAHFGSSESLPIDTVDALYGKVFMGDFMGDSLPEIVVVNSSIALYENLGGGNYGPRLEMGGSNDGTFLQLTDLTNDAIPDFLVITATQLLLYPGTEQGNLDPPQVLYDYGLNNDIHYNWNARDLDADGDPDIVFSRYFSLTTDIRMIWLENDGNGHFTTHNNPVKEQDGNGGERLLIDVDSDGLLDVVRAIGSEVTWFKNYVTAPYISGYCFLDANANKQIDTLEVSLRNIQMVLEPAAPYTFSEDDGSFRFYVEPGDYTLSYLASDCWELTTDSAEYHLHFADSLINNLAFGFNSTTDTAFAGVHIAGSPTRCATDVPYWVTLFNRSCDVAAGNVVVLPDALLSFVSADPMPDAIHGDTLFWAFSDLQPSEFRKILLYYQVAGSNNTGDTSHLQAWVYSGTTLISSTLTGNVVWPSEIRCAVDPNDKLVQRTLLPTDYVAAENELLYTIRFQNTGNDTAYQVIVRDQLSPTLDWQTFVPLGSSHPYRATVDLNTGDAVFTFEDIFLPDSNVNEATSHGFVQFTILPKAGLIPGTILPNSAGIYFDANPPVLTNEVETRVKTISAVAEPAMAQSVLIFPNPNLGVFSLKGIAPANHDMQFRILSLTGQLLLEQPAQPGSILHTVLAGDLAAGLYFLQVVSEGKVVVTAKFVKQ